jgi:hypothetical protein
MSCVLNRPIVQKQIIHIIIRIHFNQYICYYVLIVVYLTSLCVNWAFKTRVKRAFKTGANSCKKIPNLHKNKLNNLNTTFFCSTSLLKAPNRLKSLKLAWRFVLTRDIYQNLLTQEKFLKFWQCRTKKVFIRHCVDTIWKNLQSRKKKGHPLCSQTLISERYNYL